MNLIPTIISIGLAASVSVFYLQNQSDEPNKINYRAALSDFEQTALEFAGHTPLQNISAAMPPSHCANLTYDFEDRLPAGSESAIDISGLNCDMATLKISTSDEKDFQALLSAASASGRSYATETDTSATPPTKTIKWTQRLYSRNSSDLGIKAKLKNNYTGNCISCTSSTKAVRGDWSHKPDERWNGCSPPGVLACGETGTRTCNNPPPLNYGKECQRIDNSWTTPGDRTEKRNCLAVPKCGQWVKQANCPTNTCVKDEEPKIESICQNNPCKLNNGIVDSGSIVYCDTPRCGTWVEENNCETIHCLLEDETGVKSEPVRKRICTGGGCFNQQGNLVKSGTVEMCQLPTCTPLTLDRDCPRAVDNCNITEPLPKKYICNGPRCKIKGKLLNQGDSYTKSCPSRLCGILTNGGIKGIQSNCIPKDKHIQNDQPTIEYTCDGKFGCKDEKGKFYEGKKSIEESLNLPGCPYWGEWYDDKSECEYNSKQRELVGKKTMERKCYRVQSNGVEAKVGDDECKGLDTYEELKPISCDYAWGKWERTEKCPDICIKDNQKNDKYEICKAENDKFCKKEIDGIYNNNPYKNGDHITCGDVKPICGEWGEWSACEFDDDDNKGYGSCDKKDGIQTKYCTTNYCEELDGFTGNKEITRSCYTEKCQINIDNNIDKQINIDDLVKGDKSKTDLKVIISKNSYFSAPSFEKCAIRSMANFKKLKIINYGIITGYSGKGGAGAKPVFDHDYLSGLSNDELKRLNGEDGENGGDALCIKNGDDDDVKLENNGIIKGGRAGGGGGGAFCYSKRTFSFTDGIIVSGECAGGGDGGDGSDVYLPSIFKGKDEQAIIKDTFVIKSGAGGNGGVLFKENTLEVDQIPWTADRGKQGYLFKLSGYVETEVFKGKGGAPGTNGKACKESDFYQAPNDCK